MTFFTPVHLYLILSILTRNNLLPSKMPVLQSQLPSNNQVHETFMDHFCSNLFRNETSFAERQKTCVQWFEDALDHCSMSFLVPHSLDQVSYWLYDTFAKVTHFIFANTILDMDHIDHMFDAKKLSQRHCNTLYFESTKDYVELVPRYNDLLTQIMWLKMGMCLFVAVIALNCKQISFKKIKQQFNWKCNAFNNENSYISQWDLQQALVKNSLECQKYESNHLRVRTEPAINELPKVIFKVPKKQTEWDNFLGFVKENVSQDSETSSTISSTDNQNVEEIIQKIKYLFQTRRQCRILIDFEMNSIGSDDSDRFSEDIPLKSLAPELLPSRSAELIENITEPIEMMDGKISHLNIPVAYCQPVEKVLEPELSSAKNKDIARPAVRATRVATVSRPKLSTDRTKKTSTKNNLNIKKL